MRAWGVLGLQPAGAFILSLLTLLLSGAVTRQNPEGTKKLRHNQKFLTIFHRYTLKTGGGQLIRDRQRFGSHKFTEPRIFPQAAEFVVPINVVDIFVSFFHRALEVVQRTLGHSRPRI